MPYPNLTDGSGDVDFITFTGRPDRRKTQLEELNRLNADGEAYRDAGSKAGETTHQSAADFDTAAAAQAEALVYESMQGNPATFTDEHNEAFDVVIKSVKVESIQIGAVAAGGLTAGPVVLTATWRLKAAE